MESGNESKDAHEIVIDPKEMEVQINNNNDDNSDVANIKNNNMNDVEYGSKIVMEKKEHRDKDCTDDDNYKSIEMERGRKLETVGKFTKNEHTQRDNEHVDYSVIGEISDTSRSTSITQDDNMVHNSVPDDDSSNCENENLIIR